MLCSGGLHKCRFEIIDGGWKWKPEDLGVERTVSERATTTNR